MAKAGTVFEGMGMAVHRTEDPGKNIIEFGDAGMEYDGVERPGFESRGRHRNHVACVMYEVLEENGAPTHYIRPEGPAGMLARALTPFPMTVTCHVAAGGSFGERMKLPDGLLLPLTVVEFTVRGAEQSAAAFGGKVISTISEGDVKTIQVRALAICGIARDFLYDKGFVLAEMKLVFGRDSNGALRLGSEITPDTCRMWDRAEHEKIDRDRYRRETGADEASYRKLAKALTD